MHSICSMLVRQGQLLAAEVGVDNTLCSSYTPSDPSLLFLHFNPVSSTYVVVRFWLTITIDSIFHPLQVREKNMYKTVDKTIYKQAFSPENLIRCWNECLDQSSFGSRRKRVEAFNKKNYWKKKGLAIVPMKFSVGFGATSYHQVRS